MVAYFSEFVVSPGKRDAVCDAFHRLAVNDSTRCLQTISASEADAPRRVFVLHFFANEEDANGFKEDLSALVLSLSPHLDVVSPLRKLDVALKASGTAA
ncbi:MAG TPA: hypothetical protein VFU86_05425 [Terriglobales bacterium]|nr:hypothetical protein [Terriglobales bacterium]